LVSKDLWVKTSQGETENHCNWPNKSHQGKEEKTQWPIGGKGILNHCPANVIFGNVSAGNIIQGSGREREQKGSPSEGGEGQDREGVMVTIRETK